MLLVQPITVLHFTDPGCPWAYSAAPAHATLRWRYGDQLDWRLVLIGLTEDAQQYIDRGYTPERQVTGYRTFQRGRSTSRWATRPCARCSWRSSRAPACSTTTATSPPR
jgi:hypothetical protein